MRAFNRFLLAGTSHLAILVMGVGGAWAVDDTAPKTITNDSSYEKEGYDRTQALDASTTVTVDNRLAPTVEADAITIAPSLVYDSGTYNVTVNVNAAVVGGPGGRKGIQIGGCGSPSCGAQAVNSTINIASGVLVQGGDGRHGTSTSSGAGILVEDSVTGTTTINNHGTITGGAGGASYLGAPAVDTFSSGVVTINNSGTINAGTAGSYLPTFRSAIQFDQMQTYAVLNNNGGTINGNIWASKYGDQLNFSGGTLNGSILGKATSDGAIDGTAPSVTFRSGSSTTVNGDIGRALGSSITVGSNSAYWGPVNSLTVEDGATLRFVSDSQIYSQGITLYTNSIIDMGTSKVTWNHVSGGTENLSQTSIFKTTIDANAHTHGYWVFSGMSGSTMFSSGVPVITPTVIGTAAVGSKYVIIQDTAGRTVVNMPSVVNSGGYTWVVSSVTGTGQTDTDGVSYGTGTTNIVITADRLNAAGAASGTNGVGVRAIASYSGSNAAMAALSQAVNNLTSAAEIEKAGAQLRPSANGATAQAALGAVGQAVNTISVRTDSVRAASADTGGSASGVSSGEALRGLGVWGQAFGSVATQDRRLGVDGYTADTYGVAFGADAKVAEPVRLGLSFAYARTGIDDAGAREGSGQTINSYIGSLYGTYTAPRWYLDGALTYGHHSYDGTRVINIAGAARQTAKSSYGGDQYGAKAEVGVPFAVASGVVVTPLAGIAYNHLRQDGYTEKDAAAALSVGSSSTDSIKSSLGVKTAATLARWRDWDVRPNARAVWSHEFNTKAHEQTSAYVDGGSAFTNTGTDAAGESFTLGIGLDLASVRNTTLSAKYDAGLSDRYVSHTGSIQARMEF